MATDACQYFYDCRSCGVILKPNAGECCVFCSYGTGGSEACLLKQQHKSRRE